MKSNLKHMKRQMLKIIILIIATCCTTLTSSAQDKQLDIKHLGNEQSHVRAQASYKYLLLPIEESAKNAKLTLIVNNHAMHTMNVRMAINKVDYFVPYLLSEHAINETLVDLQGVPNEAVCWNEMKLSDTFDKQNREKHRPLYHFTPEYGWMNDPNGMVYKDGEYHLFYQYNPYGSKWGNMHWGHAISKDLCTWEHLPVSLAPDALGGIYSGCCVVDKENTAGFGKDAIIACYTSGGKSQTQSLAYSLDNGRTFKKYAGNPILSSDIRNFRDPKIFWHEPTRKWSMILASGQEMRIYSSLNLKEWTYESSFGKDEGAHGGVWECPDLIQLPIKGTDQKKWVLICNINPGGPYGGSATQYFVGEFDGHRFVNEFPGTTKWMDWGKDHYAAVTWNNAPDHRVLTIAWMSNWEYGTSVPTTQFRSANSVPRDLYLYKQNNDLYMVSVPAKELLALRKDTVTHSPFKVNNTYDLKELLKDNSGAYEIELTITDTRAKHICIELYNSKNEKVLLIYDLAKKQFSMDRTQSGIVSFNKEFASTTYAPIGLQKKYTLRLFIDKASIEAFDGNGKFAMTNLVFPDEPYNGMKFYSHAGTFRVSNIRVYPLGK